MSGAFAEKAVAFLRESGFDPAAELKPMAGGANNRVFLVEGDRRLVLKRFFHSPDDHRERFASEKKFYDLIWNAGVRRTPEPLAWSEPDKLGLFEFVEGEPLKQGGIGAVEIDQAIAFVAEINSRIPPAGLEGCPMASEACTHIDDYHDCVERRLRRLETAVCPGDDVDAEAARFVRERLRPAWDEIDARMRAEADHSYSDSETGLPASEQCLSPSDFGFHNAIRRADGELRFFDFEYAGMDDPAKLVCDFFCQPKVRAPLEHWGRFVAGMQELRRWDERLVERARLALPSCRAKWICIMLNEFLPEAGRRRDFASSAREGEERKIAALERARKALRELAG